MTTTNILNVPLSGSSGSGNFAGSTSPSLVTPVLGVATATSIAFSPTTNGMIGTTAADVASASYVGQVFSSSVPAASAISITASTGTNVTSVNLTAGDWDVFGNIFYIPAATTTITQVYGGLNTVSATIPNSHLAYNLNTVFATGANIGMVAPYQRINVNANTTVYLVGYITFATSTCTVCGTMFARRVR